MGASTDPTWTAWPPQKHISLCSLHISLAPRAIVWLWRLRHGNLTITYLYSLTHVSAIIPFLVTMGQWARNLGAKLDNL